MAQLTGKLKTTNRSFEFGGMEFFVKNVPMSEANEELKKLQSISKMDADDDNAEGQKLILEFLHKFLVDEKGESFDEFADWDKVSEILSMADLIELMQKAVKLISGNQSGN